MCLIAYQPSGDKPFPASALENGWRGNPHGAGYMFADGDKVIIRKPFRKLKALLKAYADDHKVYGASSPFVVHFRYATHGSSVELNIHPHSLADGKVGLVHNGILSDFLPPFEADISDTVFFCRTVLAKRDAAQLVSAEFGGILAEMIGWGNKFVLLANDGAVSIVNADEGTWDGVRWYSNDGWKERKPIVLPAGVSRGWRNIRPGLQRLVSAPPDTTGHDAWEGYAHGGNYTSDDTNSTLEDLYDYHLDRLHSEADFGEAPDWDALDELAWEAAQTDHDSLQPDDRGALHAMDKAMQRDGR